MQQQYKHPPLVEAVCEFRFRPGSAWDGTVPGRLYEQIKEEFPERQSMVSLETSIEAGAEGVQQQFRPAERLRFSRSDGSALVQVGVNLLAVNHLRPYPGWDQFLPLIERMLTRYREIVEPAGFERIGLRYVNKFPFREPTVKLEGLFDFYPHVGSRLPHEHSIFIVGVHFMFNESRDAMRLQLSDEQGGDDDILTITLDIDYFLNRAGEIAFDGVTRWLHDAHSHIEDAFQGSILDPLRSRFEEPQPWTA